MFNLRHHPLQVSRLWGASTFRGPPEFVTLAYLTYGQNAGITLASSPELIRSFYLAGITPAQLPRTGHPTLIEIRLYARSTMARILAPLSLADFQVYRVSTPKRKTS